MTFGVFRPVLTPGAELGRDGGGARSVPARERSEVTRSDRHRPVSEKVISARGLRISCGDFEGVRGVDLEVSGGRNWTSSWHRHRSTASLATKCIRWPRTRGPAPIGATQAE